MAAIDFFCSADDRHRVILLVDLLEKAGQAVTLRCEPTDAPTRPCLVACTRRAFREPWINALFTAAAQVAALRLDDAPLPGPAARIIDMQAWPARSADRNVGPLVDWLQFGDEAPAGGGASAIPPPRWSGRRRGDRSSREPLKRRLGDPNVLGGLTLLALLVVAGVLLAMTASQRQDRTAPAEPDEPFPQAPLGRGPAPADPPPGAAPEASVDRSAAAETKMADPARSAAPAPSASRAADITGSVVGRSADLAAPEPLNPVRPTRSTYPDALRHLCQARSFEAARAWAGALDWKQRRRLPNEPCVQRLLQRPGFEELVALLDLS